MPKHREKLEDKVLYVICEETRFKITRLQCESFRSPHKRKQMSEHFCMHFMQQMLATML